MPTTEDTIAGHDVDAIEDEREEGQLWSAYKVGWRRLCCRDEAEVLEVLKAPSFFTEGDRKEPLSLA